MKLDITPATWQLWSLATLALSMVMVVESDVREHRIPNVVVLFVLLALAMVAVFVGGMQYALSIGWRDAARPLVMDYVDKLATEIGSPPSVERAQALVQDRTPRTRRSSRRARGAVQGQSLPRS